MASFCFFCRKGKSSVLTALPFFSAFLGHSSLHLLRNPYSSLVQFGAKTTLPNKKITSSFILELLPLINAECHLFCHPVSFLPHRRPPPALACPRCSMPSSSVAIAVRRSRRKLPQSSSPIRCLRRLSLLSLVAVVSCWRQPSFQFIIRHRRRRRRHFLSAVDIIANNCPPLPHLLSPAMLLVSCRASSPPPSPASTLKSGEIRQRPMGGRRL